ncbi:helix-turn-helix domain-containing protein [Enterococcus asini]|nr:AraC family transcriptional regulator [Enterococcus asini]
METIASQVGFSSVSRFVQVFKEKNGVTPGRFRRG